MSSNSARLGGARCDEYFDGGPRVEAYLRRYHSRYIRWNPPAADAQSPEAEWGFEPALRDDIARFAKARNNKLKRVVFAEPENPSPAVADFYRAWRRERGLPANRLIAESFMLLDTHMVLKTGSVPFWMKFNMQPSLHFLQAYLNSADPFDEIHVMLFAHGVESVGLPSIGEWRAVLKRARKNGRFAGVDERAYPAHFGAFGRYHWALEKIPDRSPIPEPLFRSAAFSIFSTALTAVTPCA
jgi:hypothetical protein